MNIPTGSERFTFPNPQAPSSPPSTPGSSTSDQSRLPRVTPINPNKHHGFVEPVLSPPEHLAPGSGHKFSYMRSQREVTSDSEEEESEEGSAKESDDEEESEAAKSSSDEEEEEGSDEEDDEDIEIVEAPTVPEILLAPELPTLLQRSRSLSVISSVGSIPDLFIEEITEDDIGYESDTEVIFPCHCEDFQSDIEQAKEDVEEAEESDDSFDWSSSDSESLVGDMESLLLRHQEREFEEAQRQKYLRKKKRWSKGGNHKRNHAESIGSESDTEDIIPLDDADVVGSSARRLRRRTDTLEIRPRTSLLFEDPPREIEELKHLQGDGEVIDTDDELMLPPWMYPGMDVDIESSDEDESIPVIQLPPAQSRRRSRRNRR